MCENKSKESESILHRLGDFFCYAMRAIIYVSLIIMIVISFILSVVVFSYVTKVNITWIFLLVLFCFKLAFVFGLISLYFYFINILIKKQREKKLEWDKNRLEFEKRIIKAIKGEIKNARRR